MSDELTAKNTTHLLSCTHAMGRNRHYYYMECHVLKKMKDGRIKILVFGDRYWAGKEHISNTRYVGEWRLRKKEADNGV